MSLRLLRSNMTPFCVSIYTTIVVQDNVGHCQVNRIPLRFDVKSVSLTVPFRELEEGSDSARVFRYGHLAVRVGDGALRFIVGGWNGRRRASGRALVPIEISAAVRGTPARTELAETPSLHADHC